MTEKDEDKVCEYCDGKGWYINEDHKDYPKVQQKLDCYHCKIVVENVQNEFRAAISHALLGCDVEDINAETWNLVITECEKIAIKHYEDGYNAALKNLSAPLDKEGEKK